MQRRPRSSESDGPIDGEAPVPVARRVLDRVAAAEVDTVFGLPGVHNLAF
jgi:hypothetical protein